jgi:tryptophanyl-tRNA synthetase
LSLILEKYGEERKLYDYFMNHPSELEARLSEGEAKAKVIARGYLNKVREKLGFGVI